MKKILLLLFVLIIIKGCGDFEFAYKTNKNDFLLNNKTLMSVNGDDSENIYMNLKIVQKNGRRRPQYKRHFALKEKIPTKKIDLFYWNKK